MELENTAATFLIGAGDGGALFMNSYQHPTSDLELVGIWIMMKRKKDKSLGKSQFWVLMMIYQNWLNAIELKKLSLRFRH